MAEMFVARPTPVDRDIYIKFGNKCRSNGQEVRIVLEGVMKAYTEGKIPL